MVSLKYLTTTTLLLAATAFAAPTTSSSPEEALNHLRSRDLDCKPADRRVAPAFPEDVQGAIDNLKRRGHEKITGDNNIPSTIEHVGTAVVTLYGKGKNAASWAEHIGRGVEAILASCKTQGGIKGCNEPFGNGDLLVCVNYF